MLLARVAVVLSASIFAINLILGRPVIHAILFSLAIGASMLVCSPPSPYRPSQRRP